MYTLQVVGGSVGQQVSFLQFKAFNQLLGNLDIMEKIVNEALKCSPKKGYVTKDMFVCLSVCAHVLAFVCACVYIACVCIKCVYIHACTSVHVYVQYIHVFVCMWLHACVCTCAYIHMCICAWAHVGYEHKFCTFKQEQTMERRVSNFLIGHQK